MEAWVIVKTTAEEHHHHLEICERICTFRLHTQKQDWHTKTEKHDKWWWGGSEGVESFGNLELYTKNNKNSSYNSGLGKQKDTHAGPGKHPFWYLGWHLRKCCLEDYAWKHWHNNSQHWLILRAYMQVQSWWAVSTARDFFSPAFFFFFLIRGIETFSGDSVCATF